MKAVKLVVGILGFVAAALIVLETFALDTVNGVASGFLSGLGTKTGIALGAAFLVGGVLGIVFLKNKLFGIISGVIYLLGAAVGFYKMIEYKDALIWAIAAAVFGIVYLLGSIFRKKEKVPARK
jgi:hypothetical protein